MGVFWDHCNYMAISVKSRLILYSDDSILIVSDKDPKEVEQKLPSELEVCSQWLIENKLSTPRKVVMCAVWLQAET